MSMHKRTGPRKHPKQWKSDVCSQFAARTDRALMIQRCPISVTQLQHMLVLPEHFDTLSRAATLAPHYFHIRYLFESITLVLRHPFVATDYECRLRLPAVGRDTFSYVGMRLLLPARPGVHGPWEIVPTADVEAVKAFTAWAVERHMIGLRIAAARNLVRDFLELCATPAQAAKAWPTLAQVGGITESGDKARFPESWREVNLRKYKASMAAVEALLAACNVIDPDVSYDYSAITGNVHWIDKKVTAPWSGQPVVAV